MALGFSLVKSFHPQNGIRKHLVDVTLDDSYPSNGWAVTAANFKLGGIHIVNMPTIVGGYALEFDYTNSKIKAYYADYDAESDGALIECANEHDGMDGAVVRMVVEGY